MARAIGTAPVSASCDPFSLAHSGLPVASASLVLGQEVIADR